ncbi:hypothetical protein STEG23_003509, partial [Scotinomys teguina]
APGVCREAVRSPGTGAIDSLGLPCGFWEPNTGSLQEHRNLQTNALSSVSLQANDSDTFEGGEMTSLGYKLTKKVSFMPTKDPSLTVRADITGRYSNRLYTYEPQDLPLWFDRIHFSPGYEYAAREI